MSAAPLNLLIVLPQHLVALTKGVSGVLVSPRRLKLVDEHLQPLCVCNRNIKDDQLIADAQTGSQILELVNRIAVRSLKS